MVIAPSLHVVEARQQSGDRRLARAGGADDRDRRPSGEIEGEALEHGAGRVVAEPDGVEPNVPRRLHLGQGQGVGRVGHDRLGRQHLVDALERGGGSLSRRDGHAERPQRPDEQGHVGVERHELADGHLAVDDLVTADEEHEHQADAGQDVHQRDVHAADARRLERHAADVVGLRPQLLRLDALGAEPLHDADAGHALLHHRGDLRCLLLHLHHDRVDRRREVPGDRVEERQRREGEEGEERVQPHEHHDDRGEEGEVRQREGDHHDEHLHLQQVGARPTHQLPCLGVVVVADVKLLDVGEEPLAQPRLGPAALPERVVAAQRHEDARHHTGGEDADHPRPERILVGGDRSVDRLLHEAWHDDLAGGPDEPDEHTDREAGALRLQRRAQETPTLLRRGRRHVVPLVCSRACT